MTIEKPAGHDWAVRYKFEDEPEETMDVFGCMTVEDAAKEARYSLDGVNGMNAGTYEIQAIERAKGLCE